MIFKTHTLRNLLCLCLCAAMAFAICIPARAETPVEKATQVQPRASSVGRATTYIVQPAAFDEPAEFTIQDTLTHRQKVLDVAAAQLGVPYRMGGTTPSGFDCSGFVQYVYRQAGYELTRTCTTQLGDGVPVEDNTLQVGDILFFRDPGSACASTHVGIYIGDGQMIHAGSKGIGYASLDLSYWTVRYVCARRIIPVGAVPTQAEIPTLGLR